MTVWHEDMRVGRIDRYGDMLVTRAEVIDFATRFDPQPFHLDDAAAAANPLFGRLAASGWHTASMTMRMTVDYWESQGRSILGGAGVDELRWLKPVYPGDRLRCEHEVLDARLSKSRAGVGLTRNQLTAFNQDDQPVLRMITNVLMRTRED